MVGCNSIGWTEHVGVMRGLVEGKVPLGDWKERLVRDPTRLMEAYLAQAQAQESPTGATRSIERSLGFSRMRITLKLYASLSQHLPPECARRQPAPTRHRARHADPEGGRAVQAAAEAGASGAGQRRLRRARPARDVCAERGRRVGDLAAGGGRLSASHGACSPSTPSASSARWVALPRAGGAPARRCRRPRAEDRRRRRRGAARPGRLVLQWATLPARRIALFTLPRLRVNFEFDGVDDETRQRFMRRFDLYMQRGGG